jgi:hypothetical protein
LPVMSLKLFELVGTDAARPFSPFCWRTRMALAHKGYRRNRSRGASPRRP